MKDIHMWCIENNCTIVANELWHQAEKALQFDIRKWADEHFIELVEKDVWADAKKALEQAKGIHDAITEIDEQYDIVKRENIYCAEGLEIALEIIRKHTGVNDEDSD